jgi:hypothetical protein
MLERPVCQRRRKANYHGFHILIRVASPRVFAAPATADGLTVDFPFFPLLILYQLTSEFRQFCTTGSLKPYSCH